MSKISIQTNNNFLTFGGHLDVLRKLLIRISLLVICVAVIIFTFKDLTFSIILAPSECDFITYRLIENFIHLFTQNFHFDSFHVDLIATDLSSQFLTHISVALYLGLLCASPFIIYELFKFVSPALYEHERKSSKKIIVIVYLMFIVGVLMSYYILFPISFRFLGTYSVAERIHNTITLDSYISTLTTLTLLLGLVFQLPVLAYILAKLEVVEADMLVNYRKHALLIILIIAAVITPPDIITLLLVGVPLYLLYEISIIVIRKTNIKVTHPNKL